MKLSLSDQTNPTLEKSYNYWLTKKYPKGLPEGFKIGAGILVELAVRNDLCMITGKFDGEWLVCGNPLWMNDKEYEDSTYHCNKCSERLSTKLLPERTEKMKKYLKKLGV